MANDITVKLSTMDRATEALNDSDLVFVSQVNKTTDVSVALTVTQLRSHLNFENAFTSAALGLAGTTTNEVFFVYTDANKTAVNKYTNRGSIAEPELDTATGLIKVYNCPKAVDVINSYIGKLQSDSGSDQVWSKRKSAVNTKDTISSRLDVLRVNIMEFIDLVTDRPTPSDPGTWDWSPATQAAFNKVGTHVSFSISGNTRYSSAVLVYPPGYYPHRSTVTADYSVYSGYSTGRPRLTIVGEGAIIGCAVEKDFAWKLVGTILNLSYLTFIRDPSVNYAYGLKLGDETKTDSSNATTGVITGLKCLSLTKSLVAGWAFDMIIEGYYATGFRQDPLLAEPATGFEILAHVSDNSNHLTFIRAQIETTTTSNYVAVRINGNSHGATHHNIHFYGGHIETHYWGGRMFSSEAAATGATSVLQCSVNGVVLLENGTAGSASATYNPIVLEQVSQVAFNSCRIATNNTTTATFVSGTHKSLIKYSGERVGLSFRDCYFITAFTGVSASVSNIYSVVDVTEHSVGIYAYSIEGSTMNDFRRAVGTHGRVFSGRINGNRKVVSNISDDGNTWGMYSNNVDFMTGVWTRMFEVTSAGVLTAATLKSTYIDPQRARVGYEAATAGTRVLEFFPAVSTTAAGSIQSLTTGRLTLTSTADISLEPNAGAGGVRILGNAYPTVTGTYTLGTSALAFKDGFFTNAPTVVSDSRKKQDIGDIPEALLDVWFDHVKFHEFRLKDEFEADPITAKLKIGILAQDVIAAFVAAGLNWKDYDVVKFSSWEATEGVAHQPAIYDDENNLISDEINEVPAVASGNIYMVSPDLIHYIEAAASRRLLLALKNK